MTPTEIIENAKGLVEDCERNAKDFTDKAGTIASTGGNDYAYRKVAERSTLIAHCIRACIEGAKEKNWYVRGYDSGEPSLQLRGDDGGASEFFLTALTPQTPKENTK
jgi:hypothetical protein